VRPGPARWPGRTHTWHLAEKGTGTMGVVYAKQSVTVAWSDGKTYLRKDAAWDSESGLVKERPDLFTDEPARVAGRPHGRRAERPIERATRAPGEQRVTPAKKAAPPAPKDGPAGE
jgi:hypothetical protein